jgi:hypothetical protein
MNRNGEATPKEKLLEGTMVGEGLTREDALGNFHENRIDEEAKALFLRNCIFPVISLT